MSKRSLMWVYFLFSIPYGKGKVSLTLKATHDSKNVSIPYGKGKEVADNTNDRRNLAFQFPMGKVKYCR